ncbi:phage tail tape measure protein, partial [Rhodococcus erythropolis]
MAGGRIDVEVAADLSEFNSQFEEGLEGAGEAASNFAGKLAGVLAFTGAAVSFASIIDKGNEFTRTLNAMSGVSGATGEQMDAIKAKAMALGNDVELSATSANDAAAAMTELAKGGFSVEQSMEAAKGTLQLSAAAQIDAAEAATIQSQALQAFGLDASYAATASDVLA